MQTVIDRYDLECMVKGAQPTFKVMDTKPIKSMGRYDDYRGAWIWKRLGDFSEEALIEAYRIIKVEEMGEQPPHEPTSDTGIIAARARIEAEFKDENEFFNESCDPHDLSASAGRLNGLRFALECLEKPAEPAEPTERQYIEMEISERESCLNAGMGFGERKWTEWALYGLRFRLSGLDKPSEQMPYSVRQLLENIKIIATHYPANEAEYQVELILWGENGRTVGEANRNFRDEFSYWAEDQEV